MSNGLSQVGSLIEQEIERRIQERIGSFEAKMKEYEAQAQKNTQTMNQATQNFERQGQQKLQNLDKTYLAKFQATEQRIGQAEGRLGNMEARQNKLEEKAKATGKILTG